MEKLKATLNSKVFDGKVEKAVLYQAVRMYQTNKRRGTASTKKRSEVSGGGRKPWRQKGTGRARFGSTRNPLWRGGGVIFGPKPKDYSFTLPRKVRLSALRSSLNSRLNDKSITFVDALVVEKPKTKEFVKILNKLKLTTKVLFVLEKVDVNLKLASRNIQGVTLMPAADVNAFDVLCHDKLVITKQGLEVLTKRLMK